MKSKIPPHTLKILEFDAIRQMVAERTVSGRGHDLAMSLEPCNDIKLIQKNLQTVTEIRGFLDRDETFPLCRTEDLQNSLDKVRVAGALLDTQSLLDVVKTLRESRIVREFGQRLRNPGTVPNIRDLMTRLGTFYELETLIADAIDTDGNMRDQASPSLQKIRTEQQKIRDDIRSWLQRFIQSGVGVKSLQEPIVTIRDGRHVVPVRSDQRKQVDGVVHDHSASGSTIFIEPMGVVEFNNQLRDLFVEEDREIKQILSTLTEHVHQHRQGIASSHRLLGQLDFYHAAALLSLDLQGKPPRLNTDGRIVLCNARHPILQLPADCDVVPLNLSVGENAQTLVITGPNMGGKTVALKTIGLMTMMAQAGLHIPANDDSEIAVFNSIFADIGDEQSIKANLSTFSGHLKHIRAILEKSDDRTLVLLDELGAGTNPSAGSAMGIAILESLVLRGTVTVATTHFDTLKAFAAQTDGFENGSMVFNVETLAPSYEFRQGIPGASYAIEIGERLNLPAAVLERTSELMGSAERGLDEIIMDIGRKHELLDSSQEVADNLREELSTLKLSYENLVSSYEQKKGELLDCIERLLQDAQKTINLAVTNIRTEQPSPKVVDESQRTISDQRLLLQRMVDAIDSEDPVTDPKPEINPKSLGGTFSVGDKVWLESLQKAGTVLQDQGDRLRIQTDKVDITTWRSDIRLHKPTSQTPHRTSPKPTKVQINTTSVSFPELNVRGYRTKDAIDAVDRYIDQTALDDRDEIRILHGKGTGALSSAIHSFLQNHPLVESSYFAEQKDGGTGVTIVEMKD